MARLSLIILRTPGIAWPSGRIAECRAGLEERGLDVEVLAVADPSVLPVPGAEEPWVDPLAAPAPGLTEAAVAGLRAAAGDLLVVLDLAMDYAPESVLAVAEALASGEAEVVVAARPSRRGGRISGRFLGTTDPTSGLIGLTRATFDEADDSFSPVGSRFALEILARVGGRRVDVPVPREVAGAPATGLMGDLRQCKRLADDRLGNLSRLLQFCFVGASGMVVDLACYAAFQKALEASSMAGRTAPIVGGPLALATARALAIATALTWNFSLNRRLTFNDARRGAVGLQFARYVLSNLLGIAVSLGLSLALPNRLPFFHDHRLAAAVVGIVAATGISFTMARWFVFGPKPAAEGPVAPTRRRRAAGLRLHRPHPRDRPAPEVELRRGLNPASTGRDPAQDASPGTRRRGSRVGSFPSGAPSRTPGGNLRRESPVAGPAS